MQSCLEKRGIEERDNELVRNDYNYEAEYSATDKDALSDGDAYGKGTGHGGHLHLTPNCDGPIGQIDYKNFDTFNGGNCSDVNMRQVAMTRSIYNTEYEYGAKLINTEENQQDGQYVMGSIPRTEKSARLGFCVSLT